MTFIRTKKIKGHKYAYLVRNKWTKKGSRQKTKKYLGRVVEFKVVQNMDFFFYFGRNYSSESKTLLQLVTDLIEFELVKHGFKLGKDKKTWFCNDYYVRLKPFKLFNKYKKPILLGLNEGILCKYMVHKILNLSVSTEEDPRTEAYRLAKAFVEAGFKVPKDVFVMVWEKKIG
tara:strand:+ start:2995 stop:3513 length:519 start_codon:yes stop_codon:yes gene_type:complete